MYIVDTILAGKCITVGQLSRTIGILVHIIWNCSGTAPASVEKVDSAEIGTIG